MFTIIAFPPSLSIGWRKCLQNGHKWRRLRVREGVTKELSSQMVLFHRLYNEKISKRFRALHVAELSQAEFLLAAMVTEHDGINMSELCERAMMLKQQVTRIVNQLEEKGLVVRERCADNRRVVRLHATDAARALMEKLHAALHQEMEHILSEMDDGALEEYLQAMHTINRILEQLPVGKNQGE